MFVGQHHHTLDPKKRLVIPAKFRLFFPEEKFVYVSLKAVEYNQIITNLLILYPPDAWQKQADRVEQATMNREEAEWYLRKITSDTEYCKIDAQWRVIIPLRLIKAAGLKRDTMIIGMGDRIEVWDIAQWQSVADWLNQQATTLGRSIYPMNK